MVLKNLKVIFKMILYLISSKGGDSARFVHRAANLSNCSSSWREKLSAKPRSRKVDNTGDPFITCEQNKYIKGFDRTIVTRTVVTRSIVTRTVVTRSIVTRTVVTRSIVTRTIVTRTVLPHLLRPE